MRARGRRLPHCRPRWRPHRDKIVEIDILSGRVRLACLDLTDLES